MRDALIRFLDTNGVYSGVPWRRVVSNLIRDVAYQRQSEDPAADAIAA